MSGVKSAMKLTTTAKPFKLDYGKLVLAGGVFGAGFFQSKYKQQQYVKQQFENEQIYELNQKELRFYPWYVNQELDKWEGRVIKAKGYLDEDRFFVRRDKNGSFINLGEPGYLVFAPFTTTIDYLPNANQQVNSRPVKNGIMLNVGWVPQDKKDEMSFDPPVEEHEYTDKDYDPQNVKMRKVLFEKYEDDTPMYEITGVLKQGEQQSYLQRKVNWQTRGNYNWVDLPFMSRMFRFTNTEAASQAYIELIADEVQEDVYPIPSTKETFKF